MLLAHGSYHLTSRALKESVLRVKAQPCEACAAGSLCPGVYRSYIAAMGHHELRPFSAGALSRLGRTHGKKHRRNVKILCR